MNSCDVVCAGKLPEVCPCESLMDSTGAGHVHFNAQTPDRHPAMQGRGTDLGAAGGITAESRLWQLPDSLFRCSLLAPRAVIAENWRPVPPAGGGADPGAAGGSPRRGAAVVRAGGPAAGRRLLQGRLGAVRPPLRPRPALAGPQVRRRPTSKKRCRHCTLAPASASTPLYHSKAQATAKSTLLIVMYI